VSEVSPGQRKFKFQRLLKKFFYWQRKLQLYGPPYIHVCVCRRRGNWKVILENRWLLQRVKKKVYWEHKPKTELFGPSTKLYVRMAQSISFFERTRAAKSSAACSAFA
jgi:hypothetical protein